MTEKHDHSELTDGLWYVTTDVAPFYTVVSLTTFAIGPDKGLRGVWQIDEEGAHWPAEFQFIGPVPSPFQSREETSTMEVPVPKVWGPVETPEHAEYVAAEQARFNELTKVKGNDNEYRETEVETGAGLSEMGDRLPIPRRGDHERTNGDDDSTDTGRSGESDTGDQSGSAEEDNKV